MPGPIQWVKDHPYTTLGVVAGGVVLYLLFSGGSSGGGTVVYSGGGSSGGGGEGPDHTLDLAQLQLQGQMQALNTQLAIENTRANASIALAEIQGQYGIAQSAMQRDVQLSGIAAQENVQLAGISSQVQLAQLQETTNIAQIAAMQNIALANAAVYGHLAEVQADTTKASYESQVEQARIAYGAQVSVAQQQASVEKQKSGDSLWGSIIGGIGSLALGLFSDANAKVDVKTLYYDKRGRRWVQFRYAWDKPNVIRVGVIAQEVEKTDPDAVSQDILGSGFKRVRYERLGA